MGMNTRILEQIKLHELSTEKYRGTDLEEKLAELEESDKYILAMYPVSEMKQAVERKIVASKGQAAEKIVKPIKSKTLYRSRRYNIRSITAWAAILLFAAMLPVTVWYGNHRSSAAVYGRSIGSDRIKDGGPQIFLYKKIGKIAELLSDQSVVGAGNIVQISYTASGAKYGVIVSIDGNGTITMHYPDRGTYAAELKLKGEIPLDYSYQLDNAPYFERFVFITGDECFSVRKFLESIEHLKNKGLLEYADLSPYLPLHTKMSEVLLIKKE